MAKGSMDVDINYNEIQRRLKGLKKNSEKAIKATISDMKKRAPGVIASAVTGVYNIKKAEIMPGKGKKAGDIKVEGRSFEEIRFIYQGRLLTPVHFAMRPSEPPVGKNYTLRMRVFKGNTKVIGRYKKKREPNGPYAEKSGNILMGTGALKEGLVKYIPFQRMSRRREDLKKFTTISMPQMVQNETVTEQLGKGLKDLMEKRIQHQINRFNKNGN